MQVGDRPLSLSFPTEMTWCGDLHEPAGGSAGCGTDRLHPAMCAVRILAAGKDRDTLCGHTLVCVTGGCGLTGA